MIPVEYYGGYFILERKDGDMEQKSRLTTLCYIENEGAYLMLHRISKKNDVNKDKWIGVGLSLIHI